MNESTPVQGGDSVEVHNVETAAEALMARYAAEETPTEEAQADSEVNEQVEAEEAEAEIEAEASSEEDTGDATEEEAEARFETLNELAEATGMEMDEFLSSIKATTKVQGEQSEVNLADLIKGYQLESDYTRKNEALLAERKAFETEQSDAQNRIKAELEKAGHAFQLAQQQLTHEFNAIDWGELEKSDPTNFMLQRQKFGERQAQLNQAITQASEQAQSLQAEQHKTQEEAQQAYLREQNELLLTKVPAWSDASVRDAEAKQMMEFLGTRGFTPEEASTIADHRFVLLVRDAMNGTKASASVDLAKKKVKKAPKLVKPNARQNQSQAKAGRISQAVQKARKSGRVDDVAAALLARRT